MKLSELIEIEKSLRDLVFYKPGADRAYEFFSLQNKAAKSLGFLVYEIEKYSKKINIEVTNDTV